jgi:uncharacterized protein
MTPPHGLRRLVPLGLTALLALGVSLPGATASVSEDEESVLVFSRTAGFRHASIEIGIEALRSLGAEHGFAVEATEDPAVFTDEALAAFDAVVWLNTTGDVLDAEQRAAFERYVRGGGAWVGVHSAADTEYTNDFYERLLGGARFLAHPVQQPGLLLKEPPDHPSTAHLPEQWQLPFEEYYSFTASPRPNVRVLLSIDEDSYDQDPNTSNLPDSPTFPEGVSGVMGDHPMAWCHDVDAGRAWYTALGHEAYLYLLPEYRQHLLGGILTAVGRVPADCSVAAAAPAPAEPTPDAALPSAAPAPAGPPAAGAGSLPATGGSVSLVALAVLGAALALRRATGTPSA